MSHITGYMCLLVLSLAVLIHRVHTLADSGSADDTAVVDNNAIDGQTAGASIESMMSEAESRGMAVVFNTRGRMLPLIFNPLSQVVSAVQPLTVLKLGAAYSVAVYLLAMFFPSMFGLKGAAVARSFGVPALDVDFDYDYIQRSVTTAADRMATYMKIPEPECRYRAVCEAATYVAVKLPWVNEWAKKVSGAFFLNLANPYSKAWINGMMQIDCGVTYAQCKHSPYKTMLDKFVAK